MLAWRLKWWQSGLFGAFIGFLAFCCQFNIPRQHSTAWNKESFFQAFQNSDPGGRKPFSDLVIRPEFDGAYTVMCVSYSRFDPTSQKLQFEIPPDQHSNTAGNIAAILTQSLRSSDGFMTAMQKYARQNYWLRYQYQWWREPRLSIWIYPTIGAFLFGGVIPFLTFVWHGGTTPDSEANRLAQSSKDATPAEMTIKQSQQLDAATAAAQQASAVPPDSVAILAPREGPVRKLDTEPLAKPLPATVEPRKDFDGEFYPTEVHHHDSRQDSGRNS